jgi:ERCC4-type nuclease
MFSLATVMDRRYNCGMASTMRELAPAERPRERLLNQGANALKTSELIAILLRTGTSERPVLDLAEFLLAHFGSLEALSRAPIGELTKIKGVGEAKAIELRPSRWRRDWRGARPSRVPSSPQTT